MTKANLSAEPRNEMHCHEPYTFGVPNSMATRRPPVMRAQITVIQQLENLIRTAEAAGLQASVLADLRTAYGIVYAHHQEFFEANGRFWRHMQELPH